jgi:hypothetical protein
MNRGVLSAIDAVPCARLKLLCRMAAAACWGACGPDETSLNHVTACVPRSGMTRLPQAPRRLNQLH